MQKMELIRLLSILLVTNNAYAIKRFKVSQKTIHHETHSVLRCALSECNIDGEYTQTTPGAVEACSETAYSKLFPLEDDPISLNEDNIVTPGSALIVVNFQRDFLLQSQQQCVGKVEKLAINIAKLMKLFNEKKLPIILAKDLHPEDHCSFSEDRQCLNVIHPYVRSNAHPHCVYSPPDTKEGKIKVRETREYVETFTTNLNERKKGSSFHHVISDALNDLNDLRNVYVVYKGFHRDYESESVFPRGSEFTGSYAKKLRDLGTPFDLEAETLTMNELKHPRKYMIPIENLLFESNHIYVTGVTYDFSVAQTAEYGLINGNSISHATILTQLTLPAMDNNPCKKESQPLGSKGHMLHVTEELQKIMNLSLFPEPNKEELEKYKEFCHDGSLDSADATKINNINLQINVSLHEHVRHADAPKEETAEETAKPDLEIEEVEDDGLNLAVPATVNDETGSVELKAVGGQESINEEESKNEEEKSIETGDSTLNNLESRVAELNKLEQI